MSLSDKPSAEPMNAGTTTRRACVVGRDGDKLDDSKQQAIDPGFHRDRLVIEAVRSNPRSFDAAFLIENVSDRSPQHGRQLGTPRTACDEAALERDFSERFASREHQVLSELCPSPAQVFTG